MAATGYRTIRIEDCGFGAQREFLTGAGTVKPGHLLAISSGNVVIHATADGSAQKLFAVESPTVDSASAANIDTLYASGDTAYTWQPMPGDVVYAILADAQTAVAGVSLLVSNGDGTLKIATLGAGTLESAVVGVPHESVTTSGAVARIPVRII